MNMKFALIVLISLTLLSTQAQNLEIEEKLQGGPTIVSIENLDTVPNKVQNTFDKGMLNKDSVEENFGKIAKVRFKSNLL